MHYLLWQISEIPLRIWLGFYSIKSDYINIIISSKKIDKSINATGFRKIYIKIIEFFKKNYTFQKI